MPPRMPTGGWILGFSNPGLGAPRLLRSMAVMAGLCVFCGARADSREHVWPRWLSRLLAQYNPGGLFTIENTLRPDRGPFSSAGMDLKLRRVCGACNNGWMSDLEAAAQPVLAPMIEGWPTTLSADQQEIAAAWAMKTALVCALTGGVPAPTFFEESDYRTFRGTGRPLEGAHVWIGRYAGVSAATIGGTYLGGKDVGTEGCAMTLTLGRLTLQALTLRGGGPAFGGGEWLDAVRPLWPVFDDALSWPPPRGITDDELPAFTHRWGAPVEPAAGGVRSS